MADNDQQGRTPTERQAADVGVPNPEPLRERAEDLPARDPVEKAHRDVLLAGSAQDEARAKARIVEESRDAPDTPSGYAVTRVTGVPNDAERGVEYLRHKSAKRWGTPSPS